MVDMVLILKKVETITDFRELRNVVRAYEAGTRNPPSVTKFDIVTVNNIPGPKATAYEELMDLDDIDRGTRCWFLDDAELNNPQRNTLNNTGELTLNWGQVKDALRLKTASIGTADDAATRLTKSRAALDTDISG